MADLQAEMVMHRFQAATGVALHILLGLRLPAQVAIQAPEAAPILTSPAVGPARWDQLTAGAVVRYIGQCVALPVLCVTGWTPIIPGKDAARSGTTCGS